MNVSELLNKNCKGTYLEVMGEKKSVLAFA